MEDLSPSDLKSILHSKRANLYYLEHCRLLVKDGRVEYVTDEGKHQKYWNIPIANTTCIMLGTGTSITQAAVRELSKAGVLLGFCGGGGTPLFSANEVEFDVAWFLPQSEYRPTEYLQAWAGFWFDDEKRLAAAREIQHARLNKIERTWPSRSNLFRDSGFEPSLEAVSSLTNQSRPRVDAARSVSELLAEEARLTKQLYKYVANTLEYGEFQRAKRGTGIDPANRFLDYGNYLAYGLGATATWVLGLPHGMAVLHGKTRRGGLVFDAADLIKDAIILPQAFISAMRGDEEMEFRRACLEHFTQTAALDYIIETLQSVARTFKQESASREQP